MKQPDFSLGSDTTVTPIPPPPPPAVSGSSTSPSASQDCKQSTSSALPQIRNRKNSLSAVIDKLKSQHTTGDDIAVTVSSGGISASIAGGSGSSSGLVSSDPSGSGGGGNGNRERIPTPTKGTDLKSAGNTGKPGDSGKNPGEYMVKPGSEGIKLTINKTRKDPSSKSSSLSSSSSGMPSSSGMIKSSSSSSSSQSQSGSGSPKIHTGHTGLKPGVNSGPASKKPTSSSTSSSSPGLPKIPSSSSGSGSGSGNSGNSSTSSGLKTTSNPSKTPSSSSTSSSSSSMPKSSSSSSSSSTSKSISKSSGSPKLGSSSSSSDPNRSRDSSKPRPPKSGSGSSSSSGSGSGGGSAVGSGSGSDKSIFSKERKSSPAPPRDDESERTFKAIANKLDAPFGLEGFVKQLDTKFQIPKLSQRSSNSDSDQAKKTTPEKSESGSSSRSVESSKALDLVKPEAKYSTSSPVPSTSPSLPSSSSSGVTGIPSSKSDDKLTSGQIEPKTSKIPSSSVTPSHSSSSSPRLTPSPLPKLESKTPTDGSPIPGLTITPIGSMASIGGGGGSSSNDSMDLSIDLSRPPSEAKNKGEPVRGGLSIVPSSSKDDLRSSSPADIPLPMSDKPRDFSMANDDSKKLSLETALARMEESRSAPPSGSSSLESADVLLDFSGSKVPPSEPPIRRKTVTERVMAPPMFPASPSVTMHIVKSPSSLLIPSPRSGSPCITDDDLMDEALVGGK